MSFGGLSYPDVLAIGVDGAEILFNTVEVDCPETGTDVAQATNTPANRQLKAFRTSISSPLLDSPATIGKECYTLWLRYRAQLASTLKTCQFPNIVGFDRRQVTKRVSRY